MVFSDYAFDVMWQDELIASVAITENRKKIEVKKYSEELAKQPFWGGKVDLFRIYNFLEDRCYEMGRPDMPEILKQMNLKEYNPWEMVKITHGRIYEDCLWLRFPGETLTWKDVAYERL